MKCLNTLNKIILNCIPAFLTVIFAFLENNGILITNNALEVCLFATVLVTILMALQIINMILKISKEYSQSEK